MKGVHFQHSESTDSSLYHWHFTSLVQNLHLSGLGDEVRLFSASVTYLFRYVLSSLRSLAKGSFLRLFHFRSSIVCLACVETCNFQSLAMSIKSSHCLFK